MATLLSVSSNTFTTAATWALCNSTAESDSDAANTALTTSDTSSNTFTPGAITIDGVAVKVATVSASPTGTITITLFNSTDSTTVTSVTVNVADLGARGWHFFKFSGSQTLTAGKAYLIRAKTSSSTQVNLYSTATTNWSRQLRTTTTQAPASGDKLIICGELTGAGTNNGTITVTIDNPGATVYGNVTFPQSIHVSKLGLLTADTTLTTNTLNVAGFVSSFGGGTISFGTVGTPYPSGKQFLLRFNGSANGDSGVVIGLAGVLNGYGQNQRSIVRTRLNANISAGSNVSLTFADSVDWQIGDYILIAASANYLNTEIVQLSAVSGTTATASTVASAHTGINNSTDGDIRAEIMWYGTDSSNLHVSSVSISTITFAIGISGASTSVLNLSYVNGRLLGAASGTSRGLDLLCLTCMVDNCTFSFASASTGGGIGVNGGNSNCTFTNNNINNMGGTGFVIQPTTGSHTVVNNWWAGGAGAFGWNVADLGSLITNNVLWSSSTRGYLLADNAITMPFSGNICHTCNFNGFDISVNNFGDGTKFVNNYSYRNNAGMVHTAIANYGKMGVVYGFVANGNVAYGISSQPDSSNGLIFRNCSANGLSIAAQPIGIFVNGGSPIFENCVFGSGTQHTIGDIAANNAGALSGIATQIITRNCSFMSNTVYSNARSVYLYQEPSTWIATISNSGNPANFALYTRNGTQTPDSRIYRTDGPSLRLASNGVASQSYQTGIPFQRFSCPLNAGQTVVVTAWVRQSLAGDGAVYNGKKPQLYLEAAAQFDILANILLGTSNVAQGNWDLITATYRANYTGVYNFFIEVDGTTGWINVDDVNFSISNDTRGFKYPSAFGVPVTYSNNVTPKKIRGRRIA